MPEDVIAQHELQSRPKLVRGARRHVAEEVRDWLRLGPPDCGGAEDLPGSNSVSHSQLR